MGIAIPMARQHEDQYLMTSPTADPLKTNHRQFGGHGVGSPSVLNAAAKWDDFASEWYWDQNYAKLRSDDRRILEIVRDFFANSGVRNGSGVDAGAGANLYPSLALLPYCRQITLLDISTANIDWLTKEIENPDRCWDEFFAVLTRNPHYQSIVDYRALLRRIARVRQGDLLRMPQHRFDIGTMFFAAESLTTEKPEFQQAVHAFVRSLRPGAPFAIAFMSGSEGYKIDEVDFPAVAIDSDDVTQCLEGVASLQSIEDIPLHNPFRTGYEGMLLAIGWAGRGRRDGRLVNGDRAKAKPSRNLARRSGMVVSR